MTLDLKLLSCPRQVDVPIHILGGKSALITFQGVGYDPNTAGGTAMSGEVLAPSVFPGSTKLTVPGQVSPSILGYEQYDQSGNVWERLKYGSGSIQQ